MLTTLNQAKDQLGIDIDDDYHNESLERLIIRAVGLVCSDIGRDIYQTAEEVPESAEAPIVLNELSAIKKSQLETACLLQISSLDSNREVDTEKSLNKNPAYTSAIKGFRRVIIG